MVYKKYVKKNGKLMGPYYYESYRDAEGRVQKRYLGTSLPGTSRNNRKWLVVLQIFLVFLLGIIVLDLGYLSITGKTIEEQGQDIGQALENAGETLGNAIGNNLDGTQTPVETTSVTDGSSGQDQETPPEIPVETNPIPSEIFLETPPENISEVINELVNNETVSETPANETTNNETVIGVVVNDTISGTTINETSMNDSLGDENVSELGNETIINVISANFTGNLTPNNETLTNITAINTTLLNETLINQTILNDTNATIIDVKLSRGAIRLGQPVKWTKNVSLDSPGEAIVELPKEATVIEVKKIEQVDGNDVEKEANSIITGNVALDIELKREPLLKRWFKKMFGVFTGRVIDEPIADGIDVILQDNATEYVIEYETPAPTAIETETSNGKVVVISGPDDLNYTDILSYTEIPELYNVGQEDKIRVYWKENASLVEFDAYDNNENGKLDYIEWITPHLSNQTFEIILITKAEHLDENRTYIEDVYSLVQTRDSVYSLIPNGHYIRVTFEQNLTNEKDITIYAKATNASIGVYEKDGLEEIARFENVNEDGKYQIFLTNLTNSQDTFDLLSIGDVEYDYVVDPEANVSNIIWQCGDILSAGNYSLNQSLSSTGTCINVTTNNVNINCSGFSIIGKGAGNGISARNLTGDGWYGLTLRNCIINNFSIDIANFGATDINNWGYNGGDLVVVNSTIDRIDSYGGNFGVLGSGGNGGTINATSSNITTINAYGGTGGIYRGGTGGIILSTNSILGTLNIYGGANDAAGSAYPSGSGGKVNASDSTISLIKGYSGATQGQAVPGRGAVVVLTNTNITNATLNGGSVLGFAVAPFGGAGGNVTVTGNVISSAIFDVRGGAGTASGTGGVGGMVNLWNNGLLNVTNITVNLNGGTGGTSGDVGILLFNYSTALTETSNNYLNTMKLKIMNSSNGQIGWINALDISTISGILGSNVSIRNNSAFVDSTNTVLNTSANVVLYGLPTTMVNPKIYVNGISQCDETTVPTCSNFTSLNAGTIVFNVSSWSNYSVLDAGADTTNPLINFTAPTPANGTVTTSTSITINVSTFEQNLANLTFNWNGTNYNIYDNLSLVLMYNFDNISSLGDNDTKVVDLSRYSNNGTIIGGGIYNVSGKYGSSLRFDGVNDYVNITSSSAIDANGKTGITISAWAYIKSSSLNGPFIVKRNSDNTAGYLIFLTPNNTLYARFYRSTLGGWAVSQSTTTYSNNTWNHIAYMWSNTDNKIRLYLNGNEVAYSTQDIGSGSVSDDSGIALNLFRDGFDNSFGLNGSIDELRIWNRSLTAGEISELYMSNLQKYNSTQWYLYINQSKNSTAGLDNGVYTYQACASDTSGNANCTETRTISINADIIAPLVTIINPTNKTYNNAEVTSGLMFNVTLNENGSVLYSLNNGATNISMTGNESVLFGEKFNATNNSIVDGSYTFRVYANDTSGNWNRTESIVFSVDGTPPQVSIGSPVNGEVYATNSYLVNITLNERGYCIFSLDSGLTNLTMANASGFDGNGLVFNYSKTGALNDTYTLRAYCNDTIGNRNDSVFSSFEIAAPVSSGGGGGGGGGGCISTGWNCPKWDTISCTNGNKTRVCRNNCDARKTESQSCNLNCTSEIVCGIWSGCVSENLVEDIFNGEIRKSGQNERICYDKNNCIANYTDTMLCGSTQKIDFVQREVCGKITLIAIDRLSGLPVTNINIEEWKKSGRLNIQFVQGEGYCPSCYNGILDGDETGIDCGGSCRQCTNNETISFANKILWWLIIFLIILDLILFWLWKRRKDKLEQIRRLIKKGEKAIKEKNLHLARLIYHKIKEIYETLEEKKKHKIYHEIMRYYHELKRHHVYHESHSHDKPHSK